jgi:hypothetical protein
MFDNAHSCIHFFGLLLLTTDHYPRDLCEGIGLIKLGLLKDGSIE